jgi:hypothetical protein
MKNIHNLITDAFNTLGHFENNESNYFIDVKYTNTVIRSYEITIRSRNPEVEGNAFLHLILDSSNNLMDYDDLNDLFLNNNWYRFCSTFEGQICYPPEIQRILQSLEG